MCVCVHKYVYACMCVCVYVCVCRLFPHRLTTVLLLVKVTAALLCVVLFHCAVAAVTVNRGT